MYFIASTIGYILYAEELLEGQTDKKAESPEEKLTVISSKLTDIYYLIEKLTKLIIINPTSTDIKKSDLTKFLQNNEYALRDPENFRLLSSCIILNCNDLNIDKNIGNTFERMRSLDVTAVKKHLGSNKVLFASNSLDGYTIKILKELSNKKEGYRYAYNVSLPFYSNLYPIQDVNDYLEFKARCFSEYDNYHYSNKNLYSIFDDDYTHRRKGISPGTTIQDFIKGTISKLIIQTNDEFLTKGISVEIQKEIGKLYEFDCLEGKYEIKQNETGLIFYNCRALPSDKLFSLCSELRSGEYKNKPTLLFTKEKINQIVDFGFEMVLLPPLKNNNYNKMKLLLTLLLKNSERPEPVHLNGGCHEALSELATGEEIDDYITTNNLDSSIVENTDLWYELKCNINHVAHYKFEHVETAKGHKWEITGSTIEEPVFIKYYPNKCLMYLAYLAKYPQNIDAEELYETVDKWSQHFSEKILSKKKSKAKSQRKIEPKKKNKNLLEGKSPLEKAANSIDGTFTYFFGMQKNQKNEKIDPSAESIKFLFAEGHIVIGAKCLFNPKEKIHIEVEDPFLDSLLL